MKKQPFVLVEFLIAFTLFSLVATTLFGVYAYTNYTNEQLRKIERKNEAIRYAHIKLQNLFCSLEGKGHNEKDIFYTTDTHASPKESGTSLVFLCQNEGDRDHGFAATFLAKLFYDSSAKMLSCAEWPDPHKFPPGEGTITRMRIMPILDKVESVQFSFWLAPSVGDQLGNTPFRQDELGVWLDEWKKEYKIMPTLMRIKIVRTGSPDPISFHFVVSENIGAIAST